MKFDLILGTLLDSNGHFCHYTWKGWHLEHEDHVPKNEKGRDSKNKG